MQITHMVRIYLIFSLQIFSECTFGLGIGLGCYGGWELVSFKVRQPEHGGGGLQPRWEANAPVQLEIRMCRWMGPDR